jgi:probable rRNA maturation factor
MIIINNKTGYNKEINKIYSHTVKVLRISHNLQVSLTILNKKEIQELNNKYRNKNYPTDVLSFSSTSPVKEIDLNFIDIYICKEIAEEQSKEYLHSYKRELCFLFTHGLLHGLGYDHITKKEEKIMFEI